MANPYLQQAAAMSVALGAVKIKGATLESTSEGMELHRRGWPVLLVTHEAARNFANEIAEAEA